MSKDNSSYRVVFMGTPDFAVPTLEAIARAGYDLRLVVTQPDRPKGRGRKLMPPPVKTAAQKSGVQVVQTESLRDETLHSHLAAIDPDFVVVVALGQILPQWLLDLPRFGAVNVHASLLPRYRGPAPIQWAIARGERETGVTTMHMDRGVDTGDILLTATTDIEPDDTAASLHDRLSVMGAELLVQTLAGLTAGTVTPVAQDASQATYAPMLTKADGRIDWRRPAAEIEQFIRAMTPWPGAYFFCGDKRYRIHRATALDAASDDPPGTVTAGFADELRIATGKGVLLVTEIQGASGKRLPIKNFLCGCDDMACGTELR